MLALSVEKWRVKNENVKNVLSQWGIHCKMGKLQQKFIQISKKVVPITNLGNEEKIIIQITNTEF